MNNNSKEAQPKKGKQELLSLNYWREVTLIIHIIKFFYIKNIYVSNQMGMWDRMMGIRVEI